MTPESESATSARDENPATAASEPVATATRNEIGSPIGTVIAMACSTEPVSTPRRTLALLNANVAAERSAMNPPSTRTFSLGVFFASLKRCLGEMPRKGKFPQRGGVMRLRFSRTRCSAEPLRSGAPQIRDRSTLYPLDSGDRPYSEPGTIPGLQRTTPQELRAALRPGKVRISRALSHVLLNPFVKQSR